uniref:Uncharacterized protein n=1 Tax=Arundo donax TaxID=35708 RepID=A0A0A9ALE6_ARUDO
MAPTQIVLSQKIQQESLME